VNVSFLHGYCSSVLNSCSNHLTLLDLTSFTISRLLNSWYADPWPSGLRGGSSAARLLGSWVRILPRAWMSVSCDCCVMSGRGLCDGLVPRPEESYRVWCV
jgi:hypothetical protein